MDDKTRTAFILSYSIFLYYKIFAILKPSNAQHRPTPTKQQCIAIKQQPTTIKPQRATIIQLKPTTNALSLVSYSIQEFINPKRFNSNRSSPIRCTLTFSLSNTIMMGSTLPWGLKTERRCSTTWSQVIKA